MTDKERDDALIAEAERLADRDWSGDQTYAQFFAPILLELQRSGWKPKPDRAEALAWMIEGLFAEAADNPCTCTSDENSCPHCNAWERATKQTRACIVEAIDELRAEWEAERPAVVVPSEAKLWAESRLNKRSAVPLNYGGIAAQYILNGAKGGE